MWQAHDTIVSLRAVVISMAKINVTEIDKEIVKLTYSVDVSTSLGSCKQIRPMLGLSWQSGRFQYLPPKNAVRIQAFAKFNGQHCKVLK